MMMMTVKVVSVHSQAYDLLHGNRLCAERHGNRLCAKRHMTNCTATGYAQRGCYFNNPRYQGLQTCSSLNLLVLCHMHPWKLLVFSTNIIIVCPFAVPQIRDRHVIRFAVMKIARRKFR